MRIQINNLTNICREMERTTQIISRQIFELEKIIDSIFFGVPLATVRNSLKQQQAMLVSEKKKLNQMIRCLEMVCESAARCEHKVIDELEQSKISYPRFSFKVLKPNSEVLNMLK